jgi:copper ion binding protein
MTESTYTVDGMSCGHCATSVTEEVSKLAGVHKVDVDLAARRVVVTSDAPVPAGEIQNALGEAGFHLVG